MPETLLRIHLGAAQNGLWYALPRTSKNRLIGCGKNWKKGNLQYSVQNSTSLLKDTGRKLHMRFVHWQIWENSIRRNRLMLFCKNILKLMASCR